MLHMPFMWPKGQHAYHTWYAHVTHLAALHLDLCLHLVLPHAHNRRVQVIDAVGGVGLDGEVAGADVTVVVVLPPGAAMEATRRWLVQAVAQLWGSAREGPRTGNIQVHPSTLEFHSTHLNMRTSVQPSPKGSWQ